MDNSQKIGTVKLIGKIGDPLPSSNSSSGGNNLNQNYQGGNVNQGKYWRRIIKICHFASQDSMEQILNDSNTI